MQLINLYCDESNHLLHNENRIMTLGYVSCLKSMNREANVSIRNLKQKHGLNKNYEIKWTKVSKRMMPFYEELIDYFFDNSFLEFRCVIANKEGLNYERFGITHDDWYYRMYYLLLGKSLLENNKYNIYIDIKDTCSQKKVDKLKEVLNYSYYDFSSSMIQKIQQIHSHEVELMQLTDILIGAIGYRNNNRRTSKAKMEITEILCKKTNSTLKKTSLFNERKFNIFVWEAK